MPSKTLDRAKSGHTAEDRWIDKIVYFSLDILNKSTFHITKEDIEKSGQENTIKALNSESRARQWGSSWRFGKGVR